MFRPFLLRSFGGLTAEFYLQPSRGGPRGRSPPCGNSRGAFRIDLHTHLQTLFDTSFTRIAKILEIIRHPKGLSLTSFCVGGAGSAPIFTYFFSKLSFEPASSANFEQMERWKTSLNLIQKISRNQCGRKIEIIVKRLDRGV